MNIEEMNLAQLEARALELSQEAQTADLEALKGINEELEQIKTRKSALLEEAELRKKAMNAVIGGQGKSIASDKDDAEKRKAYLGSAEYSDLYAEYMKTGNDTEIRAALMTTGVTGGTIPVPTYVDDIIHTAWERSDILNRTNRIEVAGDYEVIFEISGDDAVVHAENGAAVTEENLAEGIAKIACDYVKKWKSFSKKVLAMRGEAFVRYIYDEIAYRIFKTATKTLLTQIAALPAVATTTTPAAAKITMAPGLGTVAAALAELSDEADNPTIVMNKKTWGTFKAAQAAAHYAYDPFEGYDVRFNSSLPAYDTATAGQVYMIVGDFYEGAMTNFPEGDDVAYTFDNLTRKKENIVEVLGELLFGSAVVSMNAFTLVAKPE